MVQWSCVGMSRRTCQGPLTFRGDTMSLEIGVKLTQEELNNEVINLIQQGFDMESGKLFLRGDKGEPQEVVKTAYLKLVYSSNERAQETNARIGEARRNAAAEKSAAERAQLEHERAKRAAEAVTPQKRTGGK